MERSISWLYAELESLLIEAFDDENLTEETILQTMKRAYQDVLEMGS